MLSPSTVSSGGGHASSTSFSSGPAEHSKMIDTKRLSEWHLTQEAALYKEKARDGNQGGTLPHKTLVATPQNTIATQGAGG